MKTLRGIWEAARPLPQVGATGMAILAVLVVLSGCEGVRITTDPPAGPPPFVPGSPLVQYTPGATSTTNDGYSGQHTFCLPPGMHARVFESGRPGSNAYSSSYMSTLDRPHGDPLECP